jgi:5-methylcytosine-specific restriction endonuclease McrA
MLNAGLGVSLRRLEPGLVLGTGVRTGLNDVLSYIINGSLSVYVFGRLSSRDPLRLRTWKCGPRVRGRHGVGNAGKRNGNDNNNMWPKYERWSYGILKPPTKRPRRYKHVTIIEKYSRAVAVRFRTLLRTGHVCTSTVVRGTYINFSTQTGRQFVSPTCSVRVKNDLSTGVNRKRQYFNRSTKNHHQCFRVGSWSTGTRIVIDYFLLFPL